MRIFSMFKYSKKNIKMPRECYFDQEMSQCVYWKTQEYWCTQIKRIFCIRYNKSPPSLLITDKWYDDYRTCGTHQHRGGNWRPQICDRVKSQIRQKINNDSTISLHEAAIKLNIHRTTVRNFFKNELKIFPYKLQNSLA